jgi:WD40-like Beta Propeller Repeat
MFGLRRSLSHSISQRRKATCCEIWMLTVPDGGGLGVPRQLLAAPNTSFYHPVISPDGRWLAYASNESGQFQVNVQAFPALGDKVMISKDGGDEPRWSTDGRELFYLTRGSIRNIMSVDVNTGSTFTAGVPKILPQSAGPFDVDATGQRFLILRPERLEQLEVVTNWFAELKRRVPVR